MWPAWAKCAKSIQSRDKKIYNLGGIQGRAKAAACTRHHCLLCEGRLAPPSPESQSPWSSRGRGTGGPRWSGSLALGTNSLSGGSSPLDSSRVPKARLAVAYGRGQALPHRGLHGAAGPEWVQGPAAYESSPRISFTKAAMSVFLVLCEVKKGCS